MLGKVLNSMFYSARFFGISALYVSFVLCLQDEYKATMVLLSPDQKFALLQYSYTKVQVHFSSWGWSWEIKVWVQLSKKVVLKYGW